MDTKSYRQDEVAALLERKASFGSDAVRRFVIVALHELGAVIEGDPEVPGVYDLTFRGRFLAEYPQFVKEGIRRRVTFSPSVALKHERHRVPRLRARTRRRHG